MILDEKLPGQLIRCHIVASDANVDTGLAISDSENLLYAIAGGTFEQYMAGEMPDSYELLATQPGNLVYRKVVSGKKTQNSLSVSDDGIHFADNTIQASSFTLKSLVDRITALETQVSELQTQLDAKANTVTPTFSGPVTINKA